MSQIKQNRFDSQFEYANPKWIRLTSLLALFEITFILEAQNHSFLSLTISPHENFNFFSTKIIFSVSKIILFTKNLGF